MCFCTWGKTTPYGESSEGAQTGACGQTELLESKSDTGGYCLPTSELVIQFFLTIFTGSLKVTYTGLVISKLLHKYIPKNISALLSKHSRMN